MSVVHVASRLALTLGCALALIASPAAAAAQRYGDGPAEDTPAMTVAGAEALVIDLINERRDRKGLRPLRLDPRIANVAHARAQAMMADDFFSHQDPKGKYASDYLRKAGIRFSRNSEIIAWNRASDLEVAASRVVQMWMDSPVHRHEILSRTHNYLGAGLATDGHTIKWAVVSITGTDRTDPVARFMSLRRSGSSAVLHWTGSDVRLAAGTAGLRDYDVAWRVSDGPWTVILDDTTSTSATASAPDGSAFRVRARDRTGNVSPWSVAFPAD